MSIINELNSGSIEYRDGDVRIQHPPTSLALRAARRIQELENNLVGLKNAHDMLIITNNQYFELIDQLQKDLEHERNNNRNNTNNTNQNIPLRDDAGRENEKT